MFERFTERARQVVVLAQEESRLHHDDYITTTHILLGLLREEEGLAGRILTNLGVTLEGVQEAQGPVTNDTPKSGQVPFTNGAQRVLEMSLRKALSLGHNYIGTEHILMALAREDVGCETYLDKTIGNGWREIVETETLEWLRGPRDEQAEVAEDITMKLGMKVTDPAIDDVALLKKEKLDLEDIVIDMLTGFKLWREQKMSHAEADDFDEMLCRWVEASKAHDYL